MLKEKIQYLIDTDYKNKKLSTLLTDNIFKIKYPEIYDEIYSYINTLNITFSNFSEIIYFIMYDLKHKPKCTCGKKVKYISYTIGYNQFCSNKCKANDKNLQQKKLKKYKETCIEKYGVDNISKLEEIKQKKIQTSLNNYGVKYNTQRSEMKKLLSDLLKTEERQKKLIDGCVEKFGVTRYAKSIEGRNKAKKMYYENRYERIKQYGLENNFILKKIDDTYTITANCNICNKDFEILYQLLHLRLKRNETVCTKCNLIHSFSSKGEEEIYEYIKTLYNSKILCRDRKVLNGQELDIYLPELNLAIEHNGTFWHSELNKHKWFHLDISEKCKNKNIQLLHIWQDDWIYKNEIIKSIILNKLGKSERIYARKCKIKIVDNKTKTKFLDDNHLQGNCVSKYNIGLYYNNELVSLMTFGNTRFNKNKDIELLRFCNKLNTTVVGGASKIFKYFIDNYLYKLDTNKIISYCNLDHGNGKLYENLGFNYINKTQPNYWWVVNGIKHNRFKYRKSELIKNGWLQDNETEVDCMHRLGYYRIFDSGSSIYEFNI